MSGNIFDRIDAIGMDAAAREREARAAAAAYWASGTHPLVRAHLGAGAMHGRFVQIAERLGKSLSQPLPFVGYVSPCSVVLSREPRSMTMSHLVTDHAVTLAAYDATTNTGCSVAWVPDGETSLDALTERIANFISGRTSAF